MIMIIIVTFIIIIIIIISVKSTQNLISFLLPAHEYYTT